MEIIFKNGELSIKENGKTRKVDVSSYKMFDKLNNLISSSINGKIIEQEDFDIQFFQTENTVIAILKPIETQGDLIFKEIELFFNNASYLVEEIKLVEDEESYVIIQLKNLQVNKEIPTKIFENN
jgi:outer membrane lipoprotein-sorting protein